MRTTPRSQLLLVELISDLVIFAVCAVVCVALLVQARVMTAESTDLNHAVYLAQTAAESGAVEGYPQDGYFVDITFLASADAGHLRVIEVEKGDSVLYRLELEMGVGK